MRTLLSAGPLLLALGACQGVSIQPEEPGEASISWLIGPDGCAESGVVDVVLHLESDDTEVDSMHRCEEAATHVDGLTPGEYELTLTGLDLAGVARYEATVEVDVEDDEVVNVPTVVLSALPAEVSVRWFFANGRMCAHNDVTEIDVGVFDDGYLVANRVVDCDQGGTRLDGLSSGDYVLDVLGRDDDGFAVYEGDAAFTVDKGDHARLEVALAP